MTAEQLDTIITDACPTFEERVGELHEHILDAAREALAASQEKDDGGKPKVTVSLKLVIGLNSSPPWWQTTAAVGVTFRSEGEPVNLADTNQPEFDMSIQVGDNPPIPISSANLRKLGRKRG